MSRPRRVRIVAVGLVLLFAFTAIYVAAFHAPRAEGLRRRRRRHARAGGAAAVRPRRQGARAFDVERFDTEQCRAGGAARHRRPRRLVPAARPILVAGALGTAPTDTAPARSRHAAAGAKVEGPTAAAARATAAASRPCSPCSARLSRASSSASCCRCSGARCRRGALVGGARLRGRRRAHRGVQRRRPRRRAHDHFLGIAAVSGLLALAVGAAAHGLGHLGGPVGIVAAILLLLLLGVSSAGGAVTYEFEPGFYGARVPAAAAGRRAHRGAQRRVLRLGGDARAAPRPRRLGRRRTRLRTARRALRPDTK